MTSGGRRVAQRLQNKLPKMIALCARSPYLSLSQHLLSVDMAANVYCRLEIVTMCSTIRIVLNKNLDLPKE